MDRKTHLLYRRRNPRPKTDQRGFTLIELVVVLVVLAVLAAILTPLTSNLINDARITRANRDAQTIARAVLNFNKTTGKWPIFVSGVSITTSSTIYDVLLAPGNDPSPSSSDWLTGSQGDLDAILVRNTPGYTTSGRFQWRGPYVGELGADPWGNAYLVNAKSLEFGTREAGIVLSAGPNGTIETDFGQDIGSGTSAIVIGGDDIAAVSGNRDYGYTDYPVFRRISLI